MSTKGETPDSQSSQIGSSYNLNQIATSLQWRTELSRTASIRYQPESMNIGDYQDRPSTPSNMLIVFLGDRSPSEAARPKPESSYRERSPIRPPTRFTSAQGANHESVQSQITRRRHALRAGSKPCNTSSIDTAGSVVASLRSRRRRSASPRASRQLQRECDMLVLVLEQQRFEQAMRAKQERQASDHTDSVHTKYIRNEDESRQDLSGADR